MIIYCGTRGFLDDLPLSAIKKFEYEFFKYLDTNHTDILSEIQSKKELSKSLMGRIDALVVAFKDQFK
jgi:F-type H+-transporting ATPase subunit alpha